MRAEGKGLHLLGHNSDKGVKCRLFLSYPKLADEEASILQAHVALLLDDLLDSLENVAGHCDIAANVDVSSLLPQALVHSLRQLLTQYILYIFLTERQRRNDECA